MICSTSVNCINYIFIAGCLDPWMKKHCMVTCEMCNLKPNEASISKIQPPPQQPEDPVEEDPVPEIPEPDRIEVHDIKVQPKIDPTVSQQLWKAGIYIHSFIMASILYLFAPSSYYIHVQHRYVT